MSGDTPTVVTTPLSTGTETIIEGQVLHTAATFDLTIQFGTASESCRKIVQDISIYYERCPTHCTSNDCPDTSPYQKHPSLGKCVNDCPDGYTEDGNNCVPFAFCHSSCSNCDSKVSSTQCSSCSSDLAGLNYDTFSGPAPCALTSTNNAQLLIAIDKNTALVDSVLQSVTYNGSS